MNYRLSVVLVIASLCLLPLVAADSHTREFDTIDNAPEEKERASLSHADSKKALDGFSRAISDIQSSLERCETDVCKDVRANADKRHELVQKAQQASSQEAILLVERIAAIVDEDIASLERCETDVCKDVLSQERSLSGLVGDYLDLDSDGDGLDDGEMLVDNGDLDGDGYGDVDAARADRISLVGFGSFSVSKIHEGDTTVSTSALYEPEATLLITGTGGGGGRIALHELKSVACPEHECRTVAVEVQPVNDAPTATVFFEPGFAAPENEFSIDKKDIRLGVGDAVCSQERNEIHCTSADKELLIVAFAADTDVSCADDEGTLYCWGKNTQGEETQVVFAQQASADSISKRSARTGRAAAADCDDTDCPVRPESSTRGEIILGEDRDAPARSCPDDECVTGVAERCGDDVCLASVAEHCRDDKCIVEVAERCEGDRCKAQVAERCGDESCGAEVCGPNGCPTGIADRSTDQRGLAVAAQRAHDKATPKLYEGLAPRDLNESDREGLGEYLRNRTELRGADFGLAVAYAMSNNSRVQQVRFDNESNQTHIEHEEDVRLFGFIQMRARARTVVSADGSSNTDYPWWAALGSKSSVGIEKITLAVENMYQE